MGRINQSRLKCRLCGGWMKFGLTTEKTPLTRTPAPFASVCTICIDKCKKDDKLFNRFWGFKHKVRDGELVKVTKEEIDDFIEQERLRRLRLESRRKK